MKQIHALAVIALALGHAPAAAACETGLYRSPDGTMEAAIFHSSDGSTRYTLTDGNRGGVGETDAFLTCASGELRTTDGKSPRALGRGCRWP